MVNKTLGLHPANQRPELAMHYVESAIRKIEKNPANHEFWNSAARTIFCHGQAVFSDWKRAHELFQRLEKQVPLLAQATGAKDAGDAMLEMHMVVETHASSPDARKYADYLERKSLCFYRQQPVDVAWALLKACFFEQAGFEAAVPPVTSGQVHGLKQAVRLLIEAGELVKAEAVLDHLQMAIVYRFALTLGGMPDAKAQASEVMRELEQQHVSFQTMQAMVRLVQEHPIYSN